MKKTALLLLTLLSTSQVMANIPAAPVMTLYQFNGKPEIPYYSIESFQKKGAASPAGALSQGSSLIPCLVVRKGRPLTDRSGTPYVGFTLVLDAEKATPADTNKLKAAREERRTMTVRNHHCEDSVRHVINARRLTTSQKTPFFDPPVTENETGQKDTTADGLDAIVRAFHNSPRCAAANRELVGRRAALERA
ncbi:MAG: hypothetical protein ABFS23_12215, partial [Pseudomonadota bacterium]